MTRKRKWAYAVSAIAIALMMTPNMAWAQDTAPAEEEEIVVTATLRESSIQDVPFSVNAQTQEDIERSGATSLEDIGRNVAGMSVQNLGPGQSQVSLRGVSAGQIVRDQPGVKEQVGVYLDDSVISLSLFTPDIDLFDLNRVETLRGPQGTLFGSGSVGGTIRYITNGANSSDFEGMIEGNVNSVTDGGIGGHLKGMINIPLVEDVLGLRVVAYHTEYAGFIDALREGGGRTEDVNDGTRSGFRASLSITPNSNLTITPRILYQHLEVNGFNRQERYNLFANPFTTTRPAVTFSEREQFLLLDEEFSDETFLADVSVNYDLGNTQLTSITSYLHRNILASRDASALTGSVSIDLGFPPAAALLPSNLRDTTEFSQFTQELRLASDTDSPFQWLVGAFYSDVERNYRQRLPTPGYDAYTDAPAPGGFGPGTSAAVANGFPANSPYNSDLPYDIRQWALFGEGSYDITDRFNVTIGARYYQFDEARDFISGGLFANGDNRHDETSSNGVTPRIIASYDLTPDIALNVQASQGFRLGGVNDPLNLPLCSVQDAAIFGGFQSYEDETSWNYEAGVKVTRSRYTFNAAAYYNEISDLQVTLDAGSCSSRISFNVPDAHASGVEVEFGWEPIDGLQLSFAGGFVEAEFDSTVTTGLGAVIGGIQKGNRLASVPEYQAAATAAYYWPINFGEGMEAFLAGSVQHVGSRYTQPSDQVPGAGNFASGLPFGGASGAEITALNLELDAYTLLNLSAGIQNDEWGVTLFLNNATDENANLSFDRERGGRARLAFATNQPRTLGLTVRRAF
ncbi:TonB-dependent receptor [Candidatus Viadribacter manganicus]|uniref:TonB-dependent receptor n=1 Tax=Candidatus Viadribacter manganicus TaxID=1759059 RepID=A0A1B1ALL1_9PROT|nr:TonB-dependent receptor [Candidatus Viadribacter manganicus]ANP47466.1 TonB-dependent receptor [Candidatus Viadribacter manganicus]